MFTYQDFCEYDTLTTAIDTAITRHITGNAYRVAHLADTYDRQQNETITTFSRMLYGTEEDGVNNRIASNFFRHLNTQRCNYSLGNGVQFTQDGVKDKLGITFDTALQNAGYYALIHGVSFMFWNVDHVRVFKLTEFVPLYDEETGALVAGIRFWQIAHNKPLIAVLYERDGYTRFRRPKNGAMQLVEEKKAYKITTRQAPTDAEPEIVGEENYSVLPIIPLYGNRLKQSTLVGMRESIDAYDLIRSGFANDLDECAQIYWIVSNAGGMDDADLNRFRNRLKRNHIVNVEDADDVNITPYTQEIPYAAREAFLNNMRSGIYEDFGALDVHAVAAGATNDHIDAAYQPLDDAADDYEYQIIESVQQILALLGVEDTPQFKRNRLSNQKETTEMILSAANYLDDETVLELLPFITPDMVSEIMSRKDVENLEKFNAGTVYNEAE